MVGYVINKMFMCEVTDAGVKLTRNNLNRVGSKYRCKSGHKIKSYVK